MTELVQALPFTDLGAGALVIMIVLMVLTGRLVTRQQLQDVMADRDKWRDSAESWQASSLKLGMTMEKVVVLAEATNHALTDIQGLAARASKDPAP